MQPIIVIRVDEDYPLYLDHGKLSIHVDNTIIAIQNKIFDSVASSSDFNSDSRDDFDLVLPILQSFSEIVGGLPQTDVGHSGMVNTEAMQDTDGWFNLTKIFELDEASRQSHGLIDDDVTRFDCEARGFSPRFGEKVVGLPVFSDLDLVSNYYFGLN